MFTVSVKLHEVTGSTEVTFSFSRNNKAEIAFILIFMSEDFWMTRGQDYDFFVLPGAKVLLLFPQIVQMCQQIKSLFLVRSVRQQTSDLRQPIVNASKGATSL